MSNTITVRLDPDLARWLEETAAKTGVSQGKIVREQLEKARATGKARSFMRLAGVVRAPKNLSMRKGFSRS
jgi:predicted transcriptional regulator